jgi:Putative DNA-binding domain
MPTLRDIQRDVAHSLLVPDDGAAALAHVADDIDGAAERFDIYRNNIATTLIGALRLAYPAVDKLVGRDFFCGTAQAFIAGHPPRTACLDDYGGEFPDFLAAFPAAAALAYLPDVARLEWTVNLALHAPDAPALRLDALTGLTDGEHGRVRFMRHPSVRLLSVRYPAEAIWRAVLNGDEAALADIAMKIEQRWLIVQRQAAGIVVTRLDEDEAGWTNLLFSGAALSEIMLGEDTARFAALLAEHLAGGRFCGFALNRDVTPGEGVLKWRK